MAPYLNGEPVKMEGALPLGMIEGAEFSVMRFKLSDRDRAHELSRRRGSGEESAELGRMCGIVARQYERDTSSLTKNIATVIEPGTTKWNSRKVSLPA